MDRERSPAASDAFMSSCVLSVGLMATIEPVSSTGSRVFFRAPNLLDIAAI